MSNLRIMNIISLGYYNHWCIHEYITLMLQLGKVKLNYFIWATAGHLNIYKYITIDQVIL